MRKLRANVQRPAKRHGGGRPPIFKGSPADPSKPYLRRLARDIPTLLNPAILKLREGYYRHLTVVDGCKPATAHGHMTHAAPFFNYLNTEKVTLGPSQNFLIPKWFEEHLRKQKKLSPRQIMNARNEANRIVGIHMRRVQHPETSPEAWPRAEKGGEDDRVPATKSPDYPRNEATLPRLLGFDRIVYPSDAAEQSFVGFKQEAVKYQLSRLKSYRAKKIAWNTYLTGEGGLKKFIRFHAATHRFIVPPQFPAETLDDFMGWCESIGNKTSTTGSAVVAARGFLSKIPGVSATLLATKGPKTDEPEAHALERSDVISLLQAIARTSSDRYADLTMSIAIEFLATTGVRVSNTLALTQAALTHNPATGRMRALITKTKNSKTYYVPLTRNLELKLKELITMNRSIGEKQRIFLIDLKHPRPLVYECFRRRFKKLAALAGLPETTRIHWHRGHFYVSLARIKDPALRMSTAELAKAGGDVSIGSLKPYLALASSETEQAVSNTLPIFEKDFIHA